MGIHLHNTLFLCFMKLVYCIQGNISLRFTFGLFALDFREFKFLILSLFKYSVQHCLGEFKKKQNCLQVQTVKENTGQKNNPLHYMPLIMICSRLKASAVVMHCNFEYWILYQYMSFTFKSCLFREETYSLYKSDLAVNLYFSHY